MTDPTDDDLRAQFDRFDTDKSGSIDDDEFAALLVALGVNFTPERVLTAFLAIDVNGNRRIDFGEFKSWWTKR
jgi:Ca2+-binding EF-hand superfamily protein